MSNEPGTARDTEVMAERCAATSDRYPALHDMIDALLADPLMRAAARRGSRELPKNARRAYRRIVSRMDDALSQLDGERRDVALHEAGKAAKRLRYATWAIRPVLGKPATRLQRGLKKVQQLLGDQQDTVVSRPRATRARRAVPPRRR